MNSKKQSGLSRFVLTVLVAGMVFVPAVFARATTTGNLIGPLNSGDYASPVSDASSTLNLVKKAATWMYTIFFIVAVLFFLLAAYNFLLGGSNEERVKTAKNQLTYGVIAIVVALISTGIAAMVYNFLQ
ncbi:MAG: hypothetical protein WC246_00380 [Candidatus Paceibacterota bacterium]|jgi:hypothetical protein